MRADYQGSSRDASYIARSRISTRRNTLCSLRLNHRLQLALGLAM